MARYTATPTTKNTKTRPVLGFTDDDKVNGSPNGILPLVIVISILSHNVGECLIDEVSPLDILSNNLKEGLIHSLVP